MRIVRVTAPLLSLTANVPVAARRRSKKVTRRSALRRLFTELGIQIEKLINTIYADAGITNLKAERDFNFGRAFSLIGMGDSEFPICRMITRRGGMERIVALRN